MKRTKIKLETINWLEVQKDINNNISRKIINDKYNFSRYSLKIADKNGLITLKEYKPTISNEWKDNQSKSIKKYLSENPHKHPWHNNNKFKSKPCELFKKILIESNLSFLEEFPPLHDRFFSIDIAFPDKKIGIEINGNQHYNSDGTLKKYYQDRHDLITKEGWVLLEYHYSIVFNTKLLNDIITDLKLNFNISNLDYSQYTIDFFTTRALYKKAKIKKKLYNTCKCGNNKYFKAKNCLDCYNKSRKLNKRPSLHVLLKDISTLGYCATGRKYGVSDNSIRKWVKTKF